MTPQDFSDDVCRCERCRADLRCVEPDDHACMTDTDVADLLAAIAELRPAVQPEERGRKG